VHTFFMVSQAFGALALMCIAIFALIIWVLAIEQKYSFGQVGRFWACIFFPPVAYYWWIQDIVVDYKKDKARQKSVKML
jgi:hypothetical protein